MAEINVGDLVMTADNTLGIITRHTTYKRIPPSIGQDFFDILWLTTGETETCNIYQVTNYRKNYFLYEQEFIL